MRNAREVGIHNFESLRYLNLTSQLMLAAMIVVARARKRRDRISRADIGILEAR